jgi:hypothetical protein
MSISFAVYNPISVIVAKEKMEKIILQIAKVLA